MVTARSSCKIGRGTRLNSSHVKISYAVFCLKKKKLYKSLSLVFKKKELRCPTACDLLVLSITLTADFELDKYTVALSGAFADQICAVLPGVTILDVNLSIGTTYEA